MTILRAESLEHTR
jgi:hypothetical protein